MALRNDVEQGAQNLKDKLQIELHADMRHGTVRYGGQIFNVKVFFLMLRRNITESILQKCSHC